jgi:hypothetical protein
MKTWHWIALAVLTLFSLILEVVVLGHKVPGFYIAWGFFGCVIIIYVSKWIGYLFLFRDETYYDR